jgi:hypothetical protein
MKTILTLLLSTASLAAAMDRPASHLAWIENFQEHFRFRSGPMEGTLASQGFEFQLGLKLTFVGARRSAGRLTDGRFPITRFGRRRADKVQWTGAASAGFADVYPGIDLRYHFDHGDLEYDLTLRPGAHLDRVRLATNRPFSIEPDGAVRFGEIRQSPPVAWDDQGRQVEVKYVRCGHDLCLTAPRQDAARALTIDPTIRYATYLGTSQSDTLTTAGTDAAGNLYVIATSRASPADLPILTAEPRSFQAQLAADPYIPQFIAKLSPAGQILYLIVFDNTLNLYSPTPFGTRAAVDAAGALYVVSAAPPAPFGYTSLDPEEPAWITTPTNTFLTKINSAGNDMTYRTYLPASPTAMLPDANGNLYLAGNFGVKAVTGAFAGSTTGVYQIVELDATGTQLLASMNMESIGDTVNSMAFNAQGRLLVVGTSTSTLMRSPNAMQPGNSGIPAYRSSDNGQTWQPDTGVGTQVRQDQFDPRRLWEVMGGNLMSSDDFGRTWTTRSSFGDGAFIVWYTTVRHQQGWMYALVGNNNNPTRLWRSSDGGVTWTPTRTASYVTPTVDPTNPLRLVSLQGNPSISIDGGDTWTGIVAYTYFSQPAVLIADGRQDEALIVGSTNQYTIGGYILNLVTKQVSAVLAPQLSDGIVDPANPSRIILAGSLFTPVISISDDGGHTIRPEGMTPAGYTGAFQVNTLFADARTDGTLYWTNPTGVLQRTTDWGQTWKPFTPTLSPAAWTGVLTHPDTGEILLTRAIGTDVLLSQFSADLSTHDWSTYAGGSGNEYVSQVLPNADGSITVVGTTGSPDFSTLYGGAALQKGASNVFLLRVSSDGSKSLGFNQVGSSAFDWLYGVASDANGNVVLVGITEGKDFPTTSSVLLASSGATYPNYVAVVGPDLTLRFSSLFNGNGTDSFTIAPRPDGAVWLMGTTTSTNLTTTSDAVTRRPLGYEDLYLMVFDWR